MEDEAPSQTDFLASGDGVLESSATAAAELALNRA